MLDNEQLAGRISSALDEAQRRLGKSLTQLATEHFGVSAQAINGWKTTGRIHRKRLQTLSDLSGFPLEYFLRSGENRQEHAVHEDAPRYVLHPLIYAIQNLLDEGLLSQSQIDHIFKIAKDCAELTASRRALALGKSATSTRKRA